MGDLAISIIVPAFNEEAGLAESLRSIRTAMTAFDRLGWRSELIVCDNNSTDRTADIAQTAGARVVFEPLNQIARARNTGAAHAVGDWFVFVDADTHPSPELFAEVAEAVAGGRCLAGGSTVRIDTPNRVVRGAVAAWNLTSRLNRWAAGSFIFCEAAAFREVGGFSEELFAAEEIDFFRRLKRLARRMQQRIVILRRHPVSTSGRKADLYSSREIARFGMRTILGRGRTLRSAEECFAWYDGRR